MSYCSQLHFVLETLQSLQEMRLWYKCDESLLGLRESQESSLWRLRRVDVGNETNNFHAHQQS